MRSIAEIDRDFAGMSKNCKASCTCTYPSCKCSRAGAVPIPKKVYVRCPACHGSGEVEAGKDGVGGNDGR